MGGQQHSFEKYLASTSSYLLVIRLTIRLFNISLKLSAERRGISKTLTHFNLVIMKTLLHDGGIRALLLFRIVPKTHTLLYGNLSRLGQNVHEILMLGTERLLTHQRGDRQCFSPMSGAKLRMLSQLMKGSKSFVSVTFFRLPNGFVCSINIADLPSRAAQVHLVAKGPILTHSIYMASIQIFHLTNLTQRTIMRSARCHLMRGTPSSLIGLIDHRSAMKIFRHFADIGLLIPHVSFRV